MSTTIALPLAPPAKSSSSGVEFNVQLQAVDLYRADRTIVWRQLRPLVGLATGFVVLRTVVAGSVLLLAVIGVISLVCLAIYSGFMSFGARSTLRTNRVLARRADALQAYRRRHGDEHAHIPKPVHLGKSSRGD